GDGPGPGPSEWQPRLVMSEPRRNNCRRPSSVLDHDVRAVSKIVHHAQRDGPDVFGDPLALFLVPDAKNHRSATFHRSFLGRDHRKDGMRQVDVHPRPSRLSPSGGPRATSWAGAPPLPTPARVAVPPRGPQGFSPPARWPSPLSPSGRPGGRGG